jgi:enamine deaminase RidA (YjgF/YER057c/UK114 family)
MKKNASKLEIVNVADWPPPKGYVNGLIARGKTLFVAGQVGWNEQHEFESDDMADQFGRTLDNVLAVVKAAGAEPEQVARMMVYVTDLEEYRSARRRLGPIWRARFGSHYPAMALVGVTGLVEPRAKVEIEAVVALEAE